MKFKGFIARTVLTVLGEEETEIETGVTRKETPVVHGKVEQNSHYREEVSQQDDALLESLMSSPPSDSNEPLQEMVELPSTFPSKYDPWLQDKIDALKGAFFEYGEITIEVQSVDYVGADGVVSINFSYEGIDPFNFNKKVADKKGQLNYNISNYREDFMNIEFKSKIRSNASCMFEKYTGDE